ncbi:MAG: Rieske 2Fe-2S domain-containing protein [Nitrososphaeraceae archaeon]|nr:Rieske 2Fe-2S domain-containing protein [Nitrososphaeraceae archaeon]
MVKILMDWFNLQNEGLVKVAKKSDIPLSHMKEYQVDGQSVCVANIDGKYFAINNVCSHEGGPLADGELQGYEVECPWHQSKFDMRTGEVKAPPAVEPQATFEVRIFGEDIMVKAGSSSPQVREESKGAASVVYTLVLQERQVFQGTDILTLKISKKEDIEGKRKFEHTAGQYAFFDIGSVYNDPKGPVRHFTIASSPTEEFILISTRIRDSPYKKKLDSLQNGTKVKVRGPLGKFTLHEDYSKPAIFLSGGIGVTPFRSMIKYATDKNLPVRIIMFDSNKNQENILFKMDFENCTNTNKNLRIIYTITEEQNVTENKEWKGEKGRIDMAMLKRHLEPHDLEKSIFYLCGPPPMVKAMQETLDQNLQVPGERIKVEEFTGY